MFKNNVGTIDRAVRVIVGMALLAVFFLAPQDAGWRWLALIGVVPLLTGAFGTCAIYSALGMSTKEKDTPAE